MMRVLLLVVVALVAAAGAAPTSPFLLGSGIGDITGQVTEIGFMGYAVFAQKGSGLHTRMFARAFIMADAAHPDQRVVYVSMDNCMGFQTLKFAIVERLQKQYGALYTVHNIILSGTHTHSTPGGVGATVLVDITTTGFSKVNFEAAVQGVIVAITQAHASLQPGRLKVNAGDVKDGNINRSIAAYLNDPEKEREGQNTTDHLMTVLRFEDADGTPIGMVNWYAVHGTSMNNTNTLVSSDNKGRASVLFERDYNGNAPIGQGPFVAAFGQANEGDVSPNTKGPSCADGSPCDQLHSTCPGPDGKPLVTLCTAKGPGKDMFASTRIIAEAQYNTAKALFHDEKNLVEVRPGVDFRHEYVDLQSVTVRAEFSRDGTPTKTCRAALGYGFAGGTIDGPGSDMFEEGTNKTNPFWDFVTGFIAKPSKEQIACQHPKPILIDAGMTKPMEWVPYILPIQLVQVGQLYIAAVPGEFTTMSGRRLRATIKQSIVAAGGPTDAIILIAGLSNSYTHYIATHEEYEIQRYEAASTLFGPNTLGAYQQLYGDLANALVKGAPAPYPISGPRPRDMRNSTFSFITGVVVDGVPAGTSFGDVQTQVQSSYHRGDVVSVTFWGASPRNNLMLGSSYLTLEYRNATVWQGIRSDAHWDTRFHWKRKGIDQSLVTIEWLSGAVGAPAYPSGTYRIRYFGVHKTVLQKLVPFVGVSGEFVIG